MEAKEQEESCTRASTPDKMHSTKVVAEHRSEMNERLVGHDIEMDRTEEVWTRKDERGAPRRYGSDLIGVVVCLRCPLHPLLVWSRSMQPHLVYVINMFSDSFGPLVYNVKSRQGRALVCRIIFFID